MVDALARSHLAFALHHVVAMRARAAIGTEAEGSGMVVQAVDLARTYRQGSHVVTALRGVSMMVAAGELVAVTGPSGSGKSTLLHVLGGLDAPERGTVCIEGRRLGDLSDDELTVFRRRRIGIVFQAYNLVPTLTAAENVALPLALDGVPRRTARARAGDVLAHVGLASRQGHRPDQLSGGEQQRVAIARALVTTPALVLADEPTGSLDSRTAAGVLALLRRAASEAGRAVVMVTHDPSAAAHADRVVYLTDGSVADVRSPREAIATPAARNGAAAGAWDRV